MIAFITFNPNQHSDKLLSHHSNNNELPALQENKKRERNLTSICISLAGLSSYILVSTFEPKNKGQKLWNEHNTTHNSSWIDSTIFLKREGLINVKVRAVANVCNCSVIPIYRCFQSREGLCKAVLNHSFSVFEKDLLKEIKSHNTDSHDPYWCLYSALSHQCGLVKEANIGNMKIIDELAQITHKYFSNIQTQSIYSIDMYDT